MGLFSKTIIMLCAYMTSMTRHVVLAMQDLQVVDMGFSYLADGVVRHHGVLFFAFAPRIPAHIWMSNLPFFLSRI